MPFLLKPNLTSHRRRWPLRGIFVVAVASLLQIFTISSVEAAEKLWAMGARGGGSQLRRAVASESIEKITSSPGEVGSGSGTSVEVILVDNADATTDHTTTDTTTEGEVRPTVTVQDIDAVPAAATNPEPANPAPETASTQNLPQNASAPTSSGQIQVSPAPGAPRVPASQEASPTSTATTSPAPDAKTSAHLTTKASPRGPDAAKVLGWLKNGNKRFIKQTQRRDGRSAEDRQRLTSAQNPHAIVLSCSDSRVPPELVFDQALGEIFVVRSAGATVDDATLASLEYAVEHLGPTLLIVMGHTSCGAVHAALGSTEGQTAGSAHLDRWLTDVRSRLPARAPAAQPSPNLATEGRALTQSVAADLTKRSPLLKARVEKGDLKIQPALYDLKSGIVHFD
ncbi:MAG TPA: carbonic anhydrase [Pseudobdellovibrionaceae bacterium]|nr:carbonic anhydrase [Pseudobdellovibrionaceae bacterium]